MSHKIFITYDVTEVELPKTKKELEELLTNVYTEGYQDGYDDGTNEAKAYARREKSGALD